MVAYSYNLPEWSGQLRGLYALKRFLRRSDSAGHRRLYRKIAAEKKRLVESGVDYLELHLVCRVLVTASGQYHENAAKRLANYQTS